MRILRVVGSRTLPCGCLVGLYETYGGRCVSLLDHLASECTVPEHRRGGMQDGRLVQRWLSRAGEVLKAAAGHRTPPAA